MTCQVVKHDRPSQVLIHFHYIYNDINIQKKKKIKKSCIMRVSKVTDVLFFWKYPFKKKNCNDPF